MYRFEVFKTVKTYRGLLVYKNLYLVELYIPEENATSLFLHGVVSQKHGKIISVTKPT